MKNLVFRIAEERDFEGIYSFCQMLIDRGERVSFAEIVDRQALRNWFDSPLIDLYIAVVEVNPEGAPPVRVVGMLRAKRGADRQSHETYLSCAVDPTFRLNNIAKSLTNLGLEDQRAKGVRIARTLIYHWNTASIKTIESCGFVCSGVIVMVHYDPVSLRQDDDLIYYKLLE